MLTWRQAGMVSLPTITEQQIPSGNDKNKADLAGKALAEDVFFAAAEAQDAVYGVGGAAVCGVVVADL